MPEGSERLVPEGLRRFRTVLESSGAGWGRFRRQGSVPETGVVCCLATLTGAAI